MDLLKGGSKITREPWKDGIYFKLEKGQVNSYQPKLSNYLYDEDIMISEGWLVEGIEKPMSFCNLIPYLQEGLKAKQEKWNETYIFYDHATKGILIQTMSDFPFIPDFLSFVAQDWIELNDKKGDK